MPINVGESVSVSLVTSEHLKLGDRVRAYNAGTLPDDGAVFSVIGVGVGTALLQLVGWGWWGSDDLAAAPVTLVPIYPVYRIEYTGVANIISTSNTSWTTVGAIPHVNPSSVDAGFWLFEIEVLASTGRTVSIRLYNVTDDVEVDGSVFDITSDVPHVDYTGINGALGFPSAGWTDYEVQMKMDSGSAPDVAICRSAKIVAMKE